MPIGRGFGGKPLEWLRLGWRLAVCAGQMGCLASRVCACVTEGGPFGCAPGGPARLAMPHLASSRLVRKRYLASPGRPADSDSSGDVSVWAPVERCRGTQRRFGSLGTAARFHLISVREGVGRVGCAALADLRVFAVLRVSLPQSWASRHALCVRGGYFNRSVGRNTI